MKELDEVHFYKWYHYFICKYNHRTWFSKYHKGNISTFWGRLLMFWPWQNHGMVHSLWFEEDQFFNDTIISFVFEFLEQVKKSRNLNGPCCDTLYIYSLFSIHNPLMCGFSGYSHLHVVLNPCYKSNVKNVDWEEQHSESQTQPKISGTSWFYIF